MNCTRQTALDWIHSVIHQHLPANARQFKWSCYTPDHLLRSNALGMAVDHQPQTGKVVELDGQWLLLKISRNQFFVVARELLAVIPNIGDEVCITPYARRRFDGKRLDTPVEEVQGDVTFLVRKIGQRISELPIDKFTLQCDYLRDMIEQVEQLPAPDGLRTLAQLLMDAGGPAPALTWCDVEEADIGAIDPALRFTIDTTRHQGFLTLRYKRIPDVYELDLIAADGVTIVHSQGEVYFDQLAEMVNDWVDDGLWRLAKVDILRSAKRQAGV